MSGIPTSSSISDHGCPSVSLMPNEFRGVKPKVMISEGEQVKIGQAIFLDKTKPNVKWASPANGVVKEIRYGVRRVIEKIEIAVEGNDPQSSGESVGTPSDMAAVGIGQDDAQTPPDTVAGSIFDPFDDGEDDRPEDQQGGRPQEMNKPFKDSGARGRDPLGKQTKNRRGLALAHYDALKSTMGNKKSKDIIQETNQVDELEKEYNEYKEEKGKE